MTTSHKDASSFDFGLNVKKNNDLPGGASRIPCPSQVVGPSPYFAGIDFLKVSLWLNWENRLFIESIREIKESFSGDDLTDGQGMYRSIDFGDDFTFNVQRRGAGNHPYVIKCGDVTILFSNHRVDAQHPNCRIEIGSVSCWVPGAFDLFDRILGLLIERGASVSKQKMTEGHVTADLLNVDFGLTELFDMRRWICRAKSGKQCFDNFKYNYISFGKGKIMLRVYDKTGELEPGSSKQIVFHDLWSHHLGGLPPEHVTRIEFQLRRGFFNDMKINTVYQFQENLNGIWEYCTHKWCRFTARPLKEEDRKNKNQQLFETAFLWEFVRSVCFDSAPVVTLERSSPVNHINVDHLIRQMGGIGLTVCAAVGHSRDDVVDHVVTISNLLTDFLFKKFETDNQGYLRKIDVKRNQSYVCLDSLYEGWNPKQHRDRRKFYELFS